jgi:hypothetical protein
MGAEEATSPEAQALPAGRVFRLLLLHLFTNALRGGTAAVEIGPDAAGVARSLGLEVTSARLKEIEEQMERLVSARLRVAGEGKAAPISVLDMRRLGRGTSSAWRPVLHVTERFFASLQQNAIPLDRAVVSSLAAPALDAYAWLVATLAEADTDQATSVPWAELQHRFGSGEGSGSAAFRAAFSKSLEAACQAWPAAQFTADLNGVEPKAFVNGPANPSVPMVPSSVSHESADTLAHVNMQAEPVLQAEAGLPRAEPISAAEAPPLALAPAADPAPIQPTGTKPRPEREHGDDRIRLAPKLTGLGLSVWLRAGGSGESVTIEVTPGKRYDPAQRSLLIIEPMVLQVVGSLQQRELEQIAAWAVANAELIQDCWDGSNDFDIADRVKLVPTQRW